MILTKQDIYEQIQEDDIKFIKLQFTDLFGGLKNISITSGQIDRALEGRFMVDAFHISGMQTLGRDRFFLRPDLSTFAVLPWRPQQGKVARFLCDMTDGQGKELAQSPRTILKKVLAKADAQGLCFDMNPDCDFFLFARDENGAVSTVTGDMGGYLDVPPVDRGENARRDLILTLEEMGFEIESSHHELAPGQHSVNFKQSSGIRLADQIITFRETIRTVAERHGLHATFMPKPRKDLPGSGMKMSICVYKDGKNLFEEDAHRYAYSFIAGVISHQMGMTAFSNPIVNSYKRLKTRFYAPSELYWSSKDHYAPIRFVPNENGQLCMEWTLPDGAADPYLLIASVIAAGMDGLEKELVPPQEGAVTSSLPATLLEAIRALEKDSFLIQVCGEGFISAYIQEKEKEWERYSREVTDWELREYLTRF